MTIKVRIFLRNLCCDSVHLDLRSSDRDSRLQARYHGHKPANIFALVQCIRNDPWSPHLRFGASEGAIFDEPIKTLWGHAHNRQSMTVQGDRFADNCGIARVAFLPEAKAHDNDIVMAGLAVFRSETGTKYGIHVKNRKKVRRNVLQCNFLGQSISCEIRALIEDTCHSGKDGVSFVPIQKVRWRYRVMGIRVLRILFPNRHETGRIGVGKGTKEDAIDEREDSRVCANPEG